MSLRFLRHGVAAVTLLGASGLAMVVSAGTAGAATAQSITVACPSSVAVTPALNTNLIANPGAESTTAFPSSYGLPATSANEQEPDCWTISSQSTNPGGIVSALPYSPSTTNGQSAKPANPSTEDPNKGTNLFYGGIGITESSQNFLHSYATQTVDLSSLNAGGQRFKLAGYLGGYTTQGDDTTVTATFENASGTALGTTTIGPITPQQRNNVSSLVYQQATDTVPAGTTQAVVTIDMEQIGAGPADNDAMADDLNFTIGSSISSQLPVDGGFPNAIAVSCPSTVAVAPTLNSNLISNPGAENTTPFPSSYSLPTSDANEQEPDCWTISSESSLPGGILTALPYTPSTANGQSAKPANPTTPDTAKGSNLFYGGIGILGSSSATHYIHSDASQLIDVSSLAPSGQPFLLSGYLGGTTTQGDWAQVVVQWLNDDNQILENNVPVVIGPVTATMRSSKTSLAFAQTTGVVPDGATKALVTLVTEEIGTGAADDDGMADDLNLTIGPGVDSQLAANGGFTNATACPVANQVVPALNENLIANGGAEATNPYDSAGSESLADCWTSTSPVDPTSTVVPPGGQGTTGTQGGTLSARPISAVGSSTPDPGAGTNEFYCGVDLGDWQNVYGAGGTATTDSQVINVSSLAPGGQAYQLNGYLGGYSTQDDDTIVTATFEDASGKTLGVGTIGPVLSADRSSATSLVYRASTGTVPGGTVKIVVTITTTMQGGGSNCDGTADDLALTIGTEFPPPPPAVSTIPYTAPSGSAGGLYDPAGVAAANGVVYVSNTKDNVVAALSSSGTSIVAGQYEGYGENGDEGAATSATLYQPTGLATDTKGDLYIADSGDNVIRRVTPDGIIHLYAGNGTEGHSGNGGAATSAELDDPEGVAVDSAGDVFIADADNNQVREVTPDGIIHLYAGNGTAGYRGDGGAAASAELDQPSGVAVDSQGNLYIADSANNVIRRVDAAAGTITTVAGNYAADQAADGVGGFSGNGGPANDAQLHDPQGVALDPAGDLFIADTFNSTIREVTPQGIITSVAGGNGPEGVNVDTSTNTLYVANTNSSNIEAVTNLVRDTPTGPGPVTSVAPPAQTPESPAVVALPAVAAAVLGAGLVINRRRRRAARRQA